MELKRPKYSKSLSSKSLVQFGLVVIIVFVFSLLVIDEQYLSSLKKRTSDDIDNDNDIDNNGEKDEKDEIKNRSSEEVFDWLEMKKAICPNMNPNPNVWQTIFHRARVELNLFNSTNIKERLFDDFFKFSWGGMGYIDEEDEQATVYLQIWKGANNAIRMNFNSTLLQHSKNQNVRIYDEERQKELFVNMKLIQKNMIVSKGKHSLQSIKNATKFQKTCVVTAVRDPISHFISAYNEIEFRHQLFPYQKRLPEPQEKPLLFTRYEPGSSQRFRQFVSDFVGGPLHNGWYTRMTELPHLYSMTGILYELQRINNCFGSDLSLTAYLPSLSDLNNAFPKLLNDTCPGLPPEMGEPFKIKHEHASKISSNGFERAGKEIWAEGGDISRSLCALHVMDYACYDKIPVPKLCQEVYADKDFRLEILAAAASRDNHIVRRQCSETFE